MQNLKLQLAKSIQIFFKKCAMCHVHICKPFGIDIFKDVLFGYIEFFEKMTKLTNLCRKKTHLDIILNFIPPCHPQPPIQAKMILEFLEILFFLLF
jgi:hypothetical protein